jgi:hypothetical protein
MLDLPKHISKLLSGTVVVGLVVGVGVVEESMPNGLVGAVELAWDVVSAGVVLDAVVVVVDIVFGVAEEPV